MKPSPKFALKSLAIALGALFLSLPAAHADESAAGGGERRERLQRGADRMADELGLTDDQRAKIKDLAQREKSELDALRANTSLTKEARDEQKRAVREKYHAERQAVLTPEQQAKAEKLRGKFEKRRERMERWQERREKADS